MLSRPARLTRRSRPTSCASSRRLPSSSTLPLFSMGRTRFHATLMMRLRVASSTASSAVPSVFQESTAAAFFTERHLGKSGELGQGAEQKPGRNKEVVRAFRLSPSSRAEALGRSECPKRSKLQSKTSEQGPTGIGGRGIVIVTRKREGRWDNCPNGAGENADISRRD